MKIVVKREVEIEARWLQLITTKRILGQIHPGWGANIKKTWKVFVNIPSKKKTKKLPRIFSANPSNKTENFFIKLFKSDWTCKLKLRKFPQKILKILPMSKNWNFLGGRLGGERMQKKIPAAELAGCLLFLPRLFQLQNLGQNLKLEKWSCELSSLGSGSLEDDQIWILGSPHAVSEHQKLSDPNSIAQLYK